MLRVQITIEIHKQTSQITGENTKQTNAIYNTKQSTTPYFLGGPSGEIKVIYRFKVGNLDNWQKEYFNDLLACSFF